MIVLGVMFCISCSVWLINVVLFMGIKGLGVVWVSVFMCVLKLVVKIIIEEGLLGMWILKI